MYERNATHRYRERDWEALANRIHAAITAEESLQGKLIRVVRPTQSYRVRLITPNKISPRRRALFV